MGYGLNLSPSKRAKDLWILREFGRLRHGLTQSCALHALPEVKDLIDVAKSVILSH